MEQDTTYVAMDVSKEKIAVAIAEGGRRGEVRFLGTIASSTDAVAKLVGKLAARHPRLCFCYEAGPTGYGLYRQIRSLGHECLVVAPSMVPVRPGGQIKTDRRDATALAALLRAGELTPIWVPDDAHEAMRDLVRARPCTARHPPMQAAPSTHARHTEYGRENHAIPPNASGSYPHRVNLSKLPCMVVDPRGERVLQT